MTKGHLITQKYSFVHYFTVQTDAFRLILIKM